MPRLYEFIIFYTFDLNVDLQAKPFHVLRLANVNLAVDDRILGHFLFARLSSDELKRTEETRYDVRR